MPNSVQRAVGGVLFSMAGVVAYALVFSRVEERAYMLSFANAVLNGLELVILVFWVPRLLESRRYIRATEADTRRFRAMFRAELDQLKAAVDLQQQQEGGSDGAE